MKSLTRSYCKRIVLQKQCTTKLQAVHCKYLNARFECNDIVISVYSHYPFDPNAKSSYTKCFHSMAKANLNKNEKVLTSTTTVLK